MKLIYAADDELNIRNLIKSFLEKEGYLVEIFETGDLLYEAFSVKPCDLIILDVMMPGSDGFEICSKIRKASNVPIIMLTARDAETDYITGITLGSDDYFTKPFRPLLLVMRVKAIFRRIEMEQGTQERSAEGITMGNVILLTEQKNACVEVAASFNGSIHRVDLGLTMTEFHLLAFLIENKVRAVSRDELLNKIWGYGAGVETRVTDDTVKRLRRKMKEGNADVKIETVWGFGFRLSVKEGEAKR